MDTSTGTASDRRGEEAPRRQQLSAISVSLVAWSFDLFDLFIILYVASTIGPLLFPSSNPVLELTFTYASFAVTLLMRPVGSAIFGVFSDRHGRKRAMRASIIGVGIATGLMGAVPTYAAAGLLAPAIFVLLRLAQGVFVGGVVASSHTLGTETVSPRHRGLVSGLVGGGGAGLGAVMASIVFLLVSILFPGKEFDVWGWRVMFFTGMLGAVASWLVFTTAEESPIWKNQVQNAAHVEGTPLRTLAGSKYRSVFLLSMVLTTAAGTIYYLTLGFLPTLLAKNLNFAKQGSAIVLMFASLAAILSSIAFGEISERIGRRRTFLLTGALALVLLPLLINFLKGLGNNQPFMIAVTAIAIGVIANATYAPMLVFLNERFPTAIRATGTGMAWNGGFAIGGMMPFLVTLTSPTVADLPSRLIIFLGVAALVLIVGAVANPETRGEFK